MEEIPIDIKNLDIEYTKFAKYLNDTSPEEIEKAKQTNPNVYEQLDNRTVSLEELQPILNINWKKNEKLSLIEAIGYHPHVLDLYQQSKDVKPEAITKKGVLSIRTLRSKINKYYPQWDLIPTTNIIDFIRMILIYDGVSNKKAFVRSESNFKTQITPEEIGNIFINLVGVIKNLTPQSVKVWVSYVNKTWSKTLPKSIGTLFDQIIKFNVAEKEFVFVSSPEVIADYINTTPSNENLYYAFKSYISRLLIFNNLNPVPALCVDFITDIFNIQVLLLWSDKETRALRYFLSTSDTLDTDRLTIYDIITRTKNYPYAYNPLIAFACNGNNQFSKILYVKKTANPTAVGNVKALRYKTENNLDYISTIFKFMILMHNTSRFSYIIPDTLSKAIKSYQTKNRIPLIELYQHNVVEPYTGRTDKDASKPLDKHFQRGITQNIIQNNNTEYNTFTWLTLLRLYRFLSIKTAFLEIDNSDIKFKEMLNFSESEINKLFYFPVQPKLLGNSISEPYDTLKTYTDSNEFIKQYVSELHFIPKSTGYGTDINSLELKMFMKSAPIYKSRSITESLFHVDNTAVLNKFRWNNPAFASEYEKILNLTKQTLTEENGQQYIDYYTQGNTDAEFLFSNTAESSISIPDLEKLANQENDEEEIFENTSIFDLSSNPSISQEPPSPGLPDVDIPPLIETISPESSPSFVATKPFSETEQTPPESLEKINKNIQKQGNYKTKIHNI